MDVVVARRFHRRFSRCQETSPGPIPPGPWGFLLVCVRNVRKGIEQTDASCYNNSAGCVEI